MVEFCLYGVRVYVHVIPFIVRPLTNERVLFTFDHATIHQGERIEWRG